MKSNIKKLSIIKIYRLKKSEMIKKNMKILKKNDRNVKLKKKRKLKMGPGPRFEPESQDPQSRRMTAYPTPAHEYPNRNKN